MPLLDTEKARIRAALGYPVTDPVASYQLGIPKPVQTAFLLESSMTLIEENQLPRLRTLLEALDQTEANLMKAQCLLTAQRVGDVELRTGDEGKSTPDLLEKEFCRWANRLADMLGVPLYPYSERFRKHSGPIPVMR